MRVITVNMISIGTGTVNKGRELHQILTASGWIKCLRQWTSIAEQRCWESTQVFDW